MLPGELKPKKYDSWDRESWPNYVTRLQIPNHEPTRQFYRQVVYDHLDHFNYHYPNFLLQDYCVDIEQFTAQQANDQIRSFGNKPMDWWADQYEEFAKRDQPYLIYQEMSKNHTPPFPPIVFESSRLIDNEWRVYGHPFHLIEGTHRVGYLRHMLSKDIITPQSVHDFVVLRPKDGSST
jgi:hypothetical protein